MVTDLVDVENMDFYRKVYEKSVEYKAKINDDYWDIILHHFRWGQYLNKHVDKEYEKAVVDRLADSLDMSRSHLYRMMQFGRKFKNEKALADYREEAASAGYTLTWTYIKNNVLPEATQRPDVYGGETNVVDESMRKIESMGIEMEKLRDMLNSESLDLEKKEEVVGVLLHADEVITETVGALMPDMSPKERVERSTMYLDYVRSLPCLICAGEAQAHHVDVGGVAMKGSDYVTVPLCNEHHRELHDRGDVSFQQWHGVDFNRVVIQYLSRFIQAIEEGQ